MTGEKVVLFGGPYDGLEVRPDGRRWTIYRYCARTGNYLGTKP